MSLQLRPHALGQCSGVHVAVSQPSNNLSSVQSIQSVQHGKPSFSLQPLYSSQPFRTVDSRHSVQFPGEKRTAQIRGFLNPFFGKEFGKGTNNALGEKKNVAFLGFPKGLGFRSGLQSAQKSGILGLRASLENRDIRVQSGGRKLETADVSNGQEGDNLVLPRGTESGQPSNLTPKILRILRIAAIALLAFAFFRPGFARAHVSHQKMGNMVLSEGAHHAHSHAHSLTSNNVFTSAWAGLLAGLVHTLSGPDHLAALAPLSIGRTKLESAAVGALWGCGHDVGQVLFGALFVVFRDKLHLDLLRVWGARIVGLTLMTIGGMGIYESQHQTLTCAPDDEECLAQPGAVVFASDKQAFSMATFATGIVHGLQPDALLVILPALALPSKVAGASFLVMFLLGTILAMGLYTAFIGSCSDALHKRVPWLTHRLSLVASLVAITVGVGILSSDFFGLSIFG